MKDEKKFDKYGLYGAYHWRWYGRRKAYTDNVNFLKDWVQEKNVIDIGAGDGLITHVLGVRGIDNDVTAVNLANGKGVDVILGDAYCLPFKDNEFESAILIDVLEHFSQPFIALAEIRRVITKYLYLNILVRENFVEPDHYNSWIPEDLISDLKSCGFDLVEGPLLKHKNYYFKFKKV
jgi:SAM-dependent methyltransferase